MCRLNKKYPLNREEQFEHRQVELLLKTEQIIANLKSKNIPILLENIAQEVGVSRTCLRSYPKVAEFTKEAVKLDKAERFEHYQVELILMVEQAVINLKSKNIPISHESIAQEMGISQAFSRSYPKVAEFTKEAVKLDKAERFEHRQAELILMVEQAVINLKSKNIPVSHESIAQEMGISQAFSRSYPKVAKFTKEAVKLDKAERFEHRQAELILKVKQAITNLEINGVPISQEKIANEIGEALLTLSAYPAVMQLILAAVGERYEYRNVELVSKVKQAITNLKSRGISISQQKIANEIGVPYTWPLCQDHESRKIRWIFNKTTIRLTTKMNLGWRAIT